MTALASTNAAYLIFAITVVGFILFYFINRRSARDELGAEQETAPNRKPYYDDETLEGRRLERFQFIALILLVVLVILVPLYWVLEPGRQAGAVEHRDSRFVTWGEGLFQTTANGGFNCAGCHGGMTATGGNAPYAVTNSQTGEVSAVSWYAPALNTVTYRFSDDEITYILTYGRVGSPMSAWGTDGGGPMNAQQLQTLVAYLHSIQIPREDCLPSEPDAQICPSGHLPAADQAQIQTAAEADAQKLVDQGKYDTVDAALGEALFNLNLNSGAYSCARCHTIGWSYGNPGPSGIGAYGWNLTGGAVNAHFDSEEDMISAIKTGSDLGKRFGAPTGQGTGRMPGFGNLLTDDQIKHIVEYVRSL
jgi:mono/diheme cytochrome c family protein